MATQILIAEGDAGLSREMKARLQKAGYEVTVVTHGSELQSIYDATRPRMLILDCNFPQLSATDFCRKIRKSGDLTLVLLTGWEVPEDQLINGLTSGADDCISRPISMREFIARIAAHLRRAELNITPEPARKSLEFGDLTIDIAGRIVLLKGRPVNLTSREFDLLWFLARNSGRSFSTRELLMAVWNYEGNSYKNTVKTHINRLRSKIDEDPTNPRFIHTHRGHGYQFLAELQNSDIPVDRIF